MRNLGLSRVYHTVLHFDIKDGKIWLQQNTTDIDVGQELIEMGIPKEDIVLGLHPADRLPDKTDSLTPDSICRLLAAIQALTGSQNLLSVE